MLLVVLLVFVVPVLCILVVFLVFVVSVLCTFICAPSVSGVVFVYF